jgi:hypothetical protein
LLRADVDLLAAKFRSEAGDNDESAQRAEQLSAAIQRLEWALARRKPHHGAKASAA